MKRTRVALYDFMPYGAPELLEASERHLTRALTTAMLAIAVLYALALGASTWASRHGVRVVPTVDFSHVIQPPPPIDVPLLPRAQQPLPVTPVRAAIPVPVRDEVAPPASTIESQHDLSRNGESEPPIEGGPSLPLAPPAPPAAPKIDEFVPYDEAPAVVNMVRPAYPDLAREAGVEGTVRLRVLVGLDGRVHDVHVDTSVPLLDEAAVAAARLWTFTPALASGHPVMVWVAIPVRFSLH